MIGKSRVMQGMEGMCCYLSDCTEYSTCDERDGSATQHFTCWYVWPNEKDSCDYTLPMNTPGVIDVWDCERYYAAYFLDWDPDVQTECGYNWACG